MRSVLMFAFSCLLILAPLRGQQAPFHEAHGGVGELPLSGGLEFGAEGGTYRITGGGANIWGTQDAFHFVYRRVSGDFTLTADVQFVGAGVNAHRKAVLMARQDLSAGAAYADAAVHGDGLSSLQYRAAAGGPTAELRSSVSGPVRLRLQRRGNQFTMQAGKPDEPLSASGPQAVELSGPIYVGLGVCSHDAKVLETVVFTNVRLEVAPRYRSKVTIFDLTSRNSKTVYEAEGVVEAPNWSRDGKWLLINAGGNLYRLPLDGVATPQLISVGEGFRCNNDHDLSRDGKWLSFSASSPSSRQSQVFLAAADGSGTKLLTPAAPSYFHGWSPDGKWLAFVGQRNGKYELFRVAPTGGEELRLTSAGAYDDGPDYSPDGKWIYFNSNRKDGWNIWRIPAAGGGEGDTLAQQITSDAGEDWFPHPSPNGKRIVFLTFPAGTEGHNGRMPGMTLRMIKAPGKKPEANPMVDTLVTFFGGQGSVNVNSWAPDSKRFAYVVYELLP
ncbi:MAG: TolB family protein [Acidobacteria bacterium]|nr:TolB family protein [Acidobacteriota bacterium]